MRRGALAKAALGLTLALSGCALILGLLEAIYRDDLGWVVVRLGMTGALMVALAGLAAAFVGAALFFAAALGRRRDG